MKLSLRDLCWLILIAGLSFSWVRQRLEILPRHEEVTRAAASRGEPYVAPLDEIKFYRARGLREVAQLSDADLLAVGDNFASGPQPISRLYLSEIVRRGLRTELESHYQERMKHPSIMDSVCGNALLVTAVRRTQQVADPLEIKTVAVENSRQEGAWAPIVKTEVTNSDLKEDPLRLQLEYDDYWHMQLTDAAGLPVSQANRPWWQLSQANGSILWLQPGESCPKLPLDVRYFLKPPATGRYRFELAFSQVSISRERDLSGLVVWKAAPVEVDVVNFTAREKWQAILLPAIFTAVAMVLLLGSLFIRRIFLRDRLALAIVVIIGIAWMGEVFFLKREIEHLQPDAEASWTMRLVE
jgi:hypothetical protein